MDFEGSMNSSKSYSSWQFAVFRIVFGFYLTWHFAALVPYAGELFSAKGVVPSYGFNFTARIFPNVLANARYDLLGRLVLVGGRLFL